mgnify:FL=1
MTTSPMVTGIVRWVGGVMLIVASLALSPAAHGQAEVKPGIKVGANLASFGGGDADRFFEGADEQFRTGVVLGGFVTIDPAGPFALQTELLYIQEGVQAEGTLSETTVTYKINYIEVPILAKLQIPVTGPLTPTFFAGPSVGVPVSETVELEQSGSSSSRSIDDLIDPTDVGVHVGGGLDIAAGTVEVTLDLRYQIGVTSIFRQGENEVLDRAGVEDIKNRGIGITAGLAF